MPVELPPYVLSQLQHCFELSLPTTVIVQKLAISKTTVNNIRRNYLTFGTPYPPALSKKGRKPLLTEGQQLVSYDSTRGW